MGRVGLRTGHRDTDHRDTGNSDTGYRDLRDWLRQLERLGEVREVAGATWQEDIGMATELLNAHEGTPAALFTHIPGYPPGFRVLTNAIANTRQIALTFGLSPGLSKLELSRAIAERLHDLRPLPPVTVADGPVLANVLTGEEVDVLRFPVPVWHEGDGGNRYIGTGSYDITRDPDTGWVNLGTYRVMVHDARHVGFYISPGKQGRIHRDGWLERGRPCPAAVVVGGDPLLFVGACTELREGLTEYDWAGGIKGEPYRVFEGRVTGLPLPADAEIILEGYVHPGDVRREGPFGEWTGYYASGSRDEPVLRVEAIYHRDDPILFGYAPYRPPDAQARLRAVQRSALLQDEMARAGVPDVTAAWCHEAGGSRLFVAVAIRQRYPGHARQAGHVASQCHVGAFAGRYVVVVDDDVDVSNLDEVVWAMSSRSDPATSIDVISRAWSSPLDPRISPEDRAAGRWMNSRAIIDATRPYEWRDQFPRVNAPSPERRLEALRRWGHLLQGLQGAPQRVATSRRRSPGPGSEARNGLPVAEAPGDRHEVGPTA